MENFRAWCLLGTAERSRRRDHQSAEQFCGHPGWGYGPPRWAGSLGWTTGWVYGRHGQLHRTSQRFSNPVRVRWQQRGGWWHRSAELRTYLWVGRVVMFGWAILGKWPGSGRQRHPRRPAHLAVRPIPTWNSSGRVRAYTPAKISERGPRPVPATLYGMAVEQVRDRPLHQQGVTDQCGGAWWTLRACLERRVVVDLSLITDTVLSVRPP